MNNKVLELIYRASIETFLILVKIAMASLLNIMIYRTILNKEPSFMVFLLFLYIVIIIENIIKEKIKDFKDETIQ